MQAVAYCSVFYSLIVSSLRYFIISHLRSCRYRLCFCEEILLSMAVNQFFNEEMNDLICGVKCPDLPVWLLKDTFVLLQSLCVTKHAHVFCFDKSLLPAKPIAANKGYPFLCAVIPVSTNLLCVSGSPCMLTEEQKGKQSPLKCFQLLPFHQSFVHCFELKARGKVGRERKKEAKDLSLI